MRCALGVLLIASGCGTVLAAPDPGPADADGGADASPAVSSDGGPDSGDGSTDDAATDAPTTCPGAPACERVVFMTSVQFHPDEIGGIDGADAKCNAAATNATSPRVKGRKFRAWISAGGLSASTRLAHGTKPYVRPDNAPIANDWNTFASSTHLANMNVDEHGVTLEQSFLSWTGTTATGMASGSDCNGWTTQDENANGTKGDSLKATEQWSDDGTDKCDQDHRIYCVEE